MRRSPRGATAALLGLSLSLSLLGTGAAHAAPTTTTPAASAPAPAAPPAGEADRVRLELPRPTGPFTVGRDTLHLVDRDRTDHWVPEAGPRELMVSLHYPARTGGRPARYMTTAEARAFLVDRKLDDRVRAETLSGTRTHARAGAAPVRGTFPLVVLSPGFTVSRTTLTLLAEDLASRGYVVASVDHAYEAAGASFPGGRLLTCAACEAVEAGAFDKVPTGRAADVSFVLDRLTGDRPVWRHSRMIDRARIGMAGHSVGGASAASTMAGDRRVRAGINMDGTFFDPVPAGGLDGRPFLLLGTDPADSPYGEDRSWVRDWPNLDGWKRWLTVAGSGHFTFTDTPVIGEQLGLDDLATPLSGDRSQRITREYVAAFFDQHLKGVHQPLLDGPSPDHPEVVFHRS